MNPWRTSVLVGAVVLVMAGCSATDRKVSGTASAPANAATSTTSTSPPSDRLVDPAALASFLSSPDELSDLVGVVLTPEPIFKQPETKLTVDPIRCTEVVIPGLNTTGYQGRTGFVGQGLHGDQRTSVVQVVASFPSVPDATAFRDAIVYYWKTCQNLEATITDGRSTSRYVLGAIDVVDSVASVPISRAGDGGGSSACQHSFTAKRNIAIDVRVCAPNVGDMGRQLVSKVAAKLT